MAATIISFGKPVEKVTQKPKVVKIKIYPHPYRDAGSSVRNAIGCGSGVPF